MKKCSAFLILLNIVVLVIIILQSTGIEQVPIHFTIDGTPTTYGSKYSLYILNIIPLAIYFIASLSKQMTNTIFREYIMYIYLSLLSIVCIVDIAVISGNGEIIKNVVYVLGVLFVLIGRNIDRVVTNKYMGIRNKWTLSDEKVWQKVHSRGKFVFIVMGILFFIAGLLESIFILIAVIFCGIGYLYVYSYIVYKKEGKK